MPPCPATCVTVEDFEFVQRHAPNVEAVEVLVDAAHLPDQLSIAVQVVVFGKGPFMEAIPHNGAKHAHQHHRVL